METSGFGRWVAVVCMALWAGCGSGPPPMVNVDFPTERRELARRSIGDVGFVLSAELHGEARGAHPGREFQWESARAIFAVYESITATRGSTRLPVYDTAQRSPELGPPPASLARGRSMLAALAPTICPLADGFAYRIADRPWLGVYVLGDAAFRVPLAVQGADCASVTASAPTREAALAASPGGATTCLALDRSGARDAAVDCMVVGVDADLPPIEPLPASGLVPIHALPVVRSDRDEVARRLASDRAAVSRMLERLATDPPPFGLLTFARARLHVLDVASALPLFVDTVASRCEERTKPCPEEALRLVQLALSYSGSGEPTEAACERARALGRAISARGEPDSPKKAFAVLRGFYACLDDSVRPILLAGLGTATSPDETLRSPDQTAYSLIDPNCRAYRYQDRTRVSSLCESFPRFAGTWLGDHCGPDAVLRATEIARERPRVPFDPREDQVLDGALRVLGACDTEAFEAAIAHVPPTTLAVADIRSQAHLREAFLKASGAKR